MDTVTILIFNWKTLLRYEIIKEKLGEFHLSSLSRYLQHGVLGSVVVPGNSL
jgi:hypothetical protein